MGDDTKGSFGRRLLLATAATSLATIASRPAAAQAAAAPQGQVVIGISQEITVLNPQMAGNEVDQGVWWNLFSTLWGIGPEGTFFPVLAKQVPTVENGGISADGLAWRVELRDDASWHDGTPLTAADVRFTFELIQNPQFRVRSRAGFTLVTDLATAGNTITWRMKEPFAPFLAFLSWAFIVPKHVMAAAADPTATPMNTAPIGSGPYKFVERVTGSHVSLAANTAYFDGVPSIDRLIFRFVPDLNTMYTRFRTGEIDYIGLQGVQPNYYAEAKALRDRKVEVCPRAAIENITLNLSHPALKEREVRQALYYGMDKQSIIDALYYGIPLPASSFLPPQSWVFNDKLPAHVFDPNKAAAILEAAGWKPGADGIRVKNGVRLAFSNSTTTGNPVREQAQQLLAQDWRKIGVEMTIKNLPAAVLWAKYWSESQFDSLMTGTTYTFASDPDVSQRFLSTAIPKLAGSGSNVSQYQNPEVDALLLKAVRTFVPEERAALYRDVQAKIMADLPMLPLFQYTIIEGEKSRLTGMVNNTNTLTNTWNVNKWRWTT